MDESHSQDVIAYAAQIGRLDLVSLLLAALGLILLVGGVIAFLNLRGVAKTHAIAEATGVAEATAERVTNEYLQRELPDLLEEYRSFLDGGDFSDDDANQMAGAQDDNAEGKK